MLLTWDWTKQVSAEVVLRSIWKLHHCESNCFAFTAFRYGRHFSRSSERGCWCWESRVNPKGIILSWQALCVLRVLLGQLCLVCWVVSPFVATSVWHCILWRAPGKQTSCLAWSYWIYSLLMVFSASELLDRVYFCIGCLQWLQHQAVH